MALARRRRKRPEAPTELHVLICSPHPTRGYLLGRLLSVHGHAVAVVDDERTCLQAVATEPPHAIVFDIDDELTLTASRTIGVLRESADPRVADVPVILLAGARGIHKTAILTTVDLVLPLPVHIATVHAGIERLCSLPVADRRAWRKGRVRSSTQHPDRPSALDLREPLGTRA